MATTDSRTHSPVTWVLLLALLLMPPAMRAGDDNKAKELEARHKAYLQILNNTRMDDRRDGYELEDVAKMFGGDKESDQWRKANDAFEDKLDRLRRFDEQNASFTEYAEGELNGDNGGNEARLTSRLREIQTQREKLVEMFDGRILLATPYEGRREFFGKLILDDVMKAYALAKVNLTTDAMIKAEEICADVASNTPIGGVEPMLKRMRVTAAAEVATKVLTLEERKRYSAFRQGDPPEKGKDKKKKKK